MISTNKKCSQTMAASDAYMLLEPAHIHSHLCLLLFSFSFAVKLESNIFLSTHSYFLILDLSCTLIMHRSFSENPDSLSPIVAIAVPTALVKSEFSVIKRNSRVTTLWYKTIFINSRVWNMCWHWAQSLYMSDFALLTTLVSALWKPWLGLCKEW